MYIYIQYICIYVYTYHIQYLSINPSSCGGDSDASCGCRWRLLLLLGSGISSVALRPGAVSHSPWRSFNESSAHIHLHNFQTAKRRISKWTLRSVRWSKRWISRYLDIYIYIGIGILSKSQKWGEMGIGSSTFLHQDLPFTITSKIINHHQK